MCIGCIQRPQATTPSARARARVVVIVEEVPFRREREWYNE